jgi:hypothetical protein
LAAASCLFFCLSSSSSGLSIRFLLVDPSTRPGIRTLGRKDPQPEKSEAAYSSMSLIDPWSTLHKSNMLSISQTMHLQATLYGGKYWQDISLYCPYDTSHRHGDHCVLNLAKVLAWQVQSFWFITNKVLQNSNFFSWLKAYPTRWHFQFSQF